MLGQLPGRRRAARRSVALGLVAGGGLVLHLGQATGIAAAAVQWQVITLPPPAPPAEIRASPMSAETTTQSRAALEHLVWRYGKTLPPGQHGMATGFTALDRALPQRGRPG